MSNSNDIVGMRDFTRKLDALANAYHRLPTEVAALAVKFSKERFRDQAWHDTARQPWKKHKVPRKGGKNISQTLLVGPGSGRLKKSIREIYSDNTKVIIGSDVPYAKIHNEGGTIKTTVQVKEHDRTRNGRKERVKAHSRKMNLTIPQRQFIGNSERLERELLTLVETKMATALNS
jgi:phage gpG-like protein